jgi:DNA-binding GntR family transcriptional regulator
MQTPARLPVERGTKKLSERIYELLKKDIIECVLEPGELLDEFSINRRYQIGRTPFRESCHRLEAEGLIEIVPHRGAFVASFSTKDIGDLLELRLMVEPGVADLACQRALPSEFGVLEENLAECERLLKKRSHSIPEINWNNKDFHVGVARLTYNQELINAVEGIHNKLMRIIMLAARRSPENYPFNQIHSDIYEAIKRGKAAEARKLMITDIENAREWIKDFGH